MRIFRIILGGAMVIGAIAGWLAAGGGPNAARDNQIAWALSSPPSLGAPVQEELYSALLGTGHFGAPQAPAGAPAETSEEDDKAPQIAGVSIIDGEIVVGFHVEGQGVVAKRIGESLPGGWVVMDATLERIIVDRNGEAREITVFPYDNAGI